MTTAERERAARREKLPVVCEGFRFGEGHCRPARKGEVRLFWVMEGSRKVHSDIVGHIDGDTVYFTDGGHQDAEHCYLTRRQAELFAGLVTKEEQRVGRLRERTAKVLQKALDALEAVE